MELKRIVKGDEIHCVPLSYLGLGSGFSNVKYSENGVYVSLSPEETMAVFISDSDLRKIGYYHRTPAKLRAKKEVKKAHAKKKKKKRG